MRLGIFSQSLRLLAIGAELMPVSRRQFLKSAAAVSIGFAGLHRHLAWGDSALESRFGPLVRDPEGILDLPEGFSYRILSRIGQAMDDGLRVPGAADGMAAFPGPEGRVVLVRNHELSSGAREAGAFGDDNEALANSALEAAKDQLGRYLADERLARQHPTVRFTGIALVFRGWELVGAEPVEVA